MNAFVAQERQAQAAYFRGAGIKADHGSSAWRLETRTHNLAPSIRTVADPYFGPPRSITWHRHANHGLSSQVCCLNFLMPLAERPDVLSRLVGRALGIAAPEMLPVEPGPDGRDWFVGFEWTGTENYLDEWPAGGKATRGANATSADAVVRFRGEAGAETLLIEWKYTEAYGAALNDRRSADGLSGGNLTRTARYGDKAFHPDGPIRNDRSLSVEDFYWEPFYQLLRQQMLAWRMEQATRERTRVLHISPRGNTALHKVTSGKIGDATGQTDAFDAFKALLEPTADGAPRFVSVYAEDLFGPEIAAMPNDPWAAYLNDRYTFLTGDQPSSRDET